MSQTTFPTQSRDLPVYQWNTAERFQLVEKMRGMGQQRLEGLNISRQFWVDENGAALTYRDNIQGRRQTIWRLDAGPDQVIGAVRVNGEGQLITTNPISEAHGVEIRERNLNLQAIGRVENTDEIQATGWQTDANSLRVTFDLPPGWRMLALFGADDVEGDWLTAWTLLDLFLLLIFALAITRIWGIPAGIVALLAFGVAYHEPGTPRLTWLLLLMPVALLKVVPAGAARKLIIGWKYVAVGLLLINLIPAIASQIQSALYPQLEPAGTTYGSRPMFQPPSRARPRRRASRCRRPPTCRGRRASRSFQQ